MKGIIFSNNHKQINSGLQETSKCKHKKADHLTRDITVVSEHNLGQLWAHRNGIKVHVETCVYMQMHVSDVGEVHVRTKVFLCQLVRK